MRYRLRILKPETETDGFGSERTVWTETGRAWAERVKVSPRHHIEADEMFPDTSAEFRIRWHHHVEPNWRVEEIGGPLYNVANVVPNIERGIKTLHCERTNL